MGEGGRSGRMVKRGWGVLLAASVGGCGASSAHASHAGHAGHAGHHGHGSFGDAERWAAVFDDPARDAWQRPDEVMRAMQLSPTMTVADVGAGTGYFSVRLARALGEGRVIATDVEPEMVRYLAARAQREGLSNLQAAQATVGSCGLGAESVDRVLIVHVWHHLEGREAYARDLATALRPGGAVFVVDFAATAQRGPPAAMRVAPETVVNELRSAGLDARVSPIALPDQYIVEARRSR